MFHRRASWPDDCRLNIARVRLAGQRLFEAFPDNPDDPSADGVSNLYASLKLAEETGRAHAMPVQRYDIRDPTGKFVERYWRLVNKPVLGESSRLIYLLHHVEDVTSEVLTMPRRGASAGT